MFDPVGAHVRRFPQVVTSLTLIVCGVVLAFPLFGYGYLGGFTRYVADDYCSSRTLAQHGFWGSQVWSYRNHSGRFFSYFVTIAAEFFGKQRIVPFVAAILLISWLVVMTWTVWRLVKLLGWRHGFLGSIVLSELFLFAMLRTGPDPGQSFFWETGAFTYTLPIILLTLYLGLLFYYVRDQPRGTRQTLILWLAGATSFCAAASSETNAAVQCIGFLAAILICKWGRSVGESMRRCLPVLHFGFWGALVSSLVVVLAPGNAVREGKQRKVAAALPFVTVVVKSLVGSVVFVLHFLHHCPVAAVAVLGVPAIMIWMEKSTPPLQMPWRTAAGACLLAGACSFVLIFVSIFPGVFALSDLPPKRAEFIPHWIMLATLLCAGAALGSAAKRWRVVTPGLFLTLATSALILLLTLPWVLKSTWSTMAYAHESRLYAAEWDVEDAHIRQLKALGGPNIVLPWDARIASGGNVQGLDSLSANPTFWVNKCMAEYYGVQSIRASPPTAK